MRTLIKVVSVCLFLQCWCSASSDVAILQSSNFADTRQFKNNFLISGLQEPSPRKSSPIQYMETPNFEVMLLTEDNSNPTWRKYSELFQPKDLRNAPRIEVNFGNHDNFPHPSVDLDRSEVEAVLAMLGDKKHIFVLHQRNCRPPLSSLDEFENKFLPELLQQLYKPKVSGRPNAGSASNTDPVIDRILSLLDSDEQKMLDDLRKTYEKPIYSNGNENGQKINSRPIDIGSQMASAPTTPGVSNSRDRLDMDSQGPKVQLRDMLYKTPCNEGYVFLIESQKNPMDPNEMSDLLLRGMKVVTRMTRGGL